MQEQRLHDGGERVDTVHRGQWLSERQFCVARRSVAQLAQLLAKQGLRSLVRAGTQKRLDHQQRRCRSPDVGRRRPPAAPEGRPSSSITNAVRWPGLWGLISSKAVGGPTLPTAAHYCPALDAGLPQVSHEDRSASDWHTAW